VTVAEPHLGADPAEVGGEPTGRPEDGARRPQDRADRGRGEGESVHTGGPKCGNIPVYHSYTPPESGK
jgi:hypothetical protein